jgi:hypothetical protein
MSLNRAGVKELNGKMTGYKTSRDMLTEMHNLARQMVELVEVEAVLMEHPVAALRSRKTGLMENISPELWASLIWRAGELAGDPRYKLPNPSTSLSFKVDAMADAIYDVEMVGEISPSTKRKLLKAGLSK